MLTHNTGKGKSYVTDRLWHGQLSPSGQGCTAAEGESPSSVFHSCWVLFFPHRTSRLGPAEVPAAKAVHSEGRPCSAFPPGPAQADLVSASCSGGCSYSYRYLFKEPFWICQKGRYSNRKQARNMNRQCIKGEVQMASTCIRKMCNLASNWWKVIEPEGIW